MTSDITARLELLKTQYTGTFAAKSAELVAALDLLRNGDPEAVSTLRHLAHKLAGSGASYGFSELSARAKRVEGAAIARQENTATEPGEDDSGGVLEARCQALIDYLDTESSNG